MDKVRLCLSYSFAPRNGGPQWKDSQICMFSRMGTENYIHFVSPMLFENFTFVLYYNNLPPLFPLIIPLFHLKFTISSHYCFTHIHTQSSESMWYCFVCRYVFRGDHLVWIAYMGAHNWRRQILLPLEICSSSSGVFFPEISPSHLVLPFSGHCLVSYVVEISEMQLLTSLEDTFSQQISWSSNLIIFPPPLPQCFLHLRCRGCIVSSVGTGHSMARCSLQFWPVVDF